MEGQDRGLRPLTIDHQSYYRIYIRPQSNLYNRILFNDNIYTLSRNFDCGCSKPAPLPEHPELDPLKSKWQRLSRVRSCPRLRPGGPAGLWIHRGPTAQVVGYRRHAHAGVGVTCRGGGHMCKTVTVVRYGSDASSSSACCWQVVSRDQS